MRRALIVLVALALAACSSSDGDMEETPQSLDSTTTTAPETTMTTTTTTDPGPFAVTSPEFTRGAIIPVEFTCDGIDVNPPLDIAGIPEGTQSLVILVDDPDAPLGTWDHWIEFDIPAESGSFEIPRDAGILGTSGINSWNLEGYRGPCPPEGDETHTYRFTVYALSGFLGLPAGVDGEAVRAAMEGPVIESAELTGTYSR